MSMSVGAVSLDLEIQNTIVKKLRAAAKSGEQAAGSAFSRVGQNVADAIKRPMDEVDRRIGESVGKVKSWTEMTAEELARLNPEFRAPVVKKSALASQMTADPYGAENRPQPAKIGDMFTVAVDRVELLRQKLDIVNAQLGEQEAKLKALTAQYNETANSKGADSGAAREIDSQITAVQARMVSLQQSVNQTEAAIRKASSGSSGQIQADANRSSGAVGKAMTSVRKKVSDAFKGAGKSAGRHLKDIGRRVNGLSRSVKSAFKSAFLMAGLYAAFRGIKSLIGDAVGQNKEFAASLNLIKANLLTAFTPIVQAVQPALNALASGFAAVSQRIAAATAGLFGQTYAQAAASAKKMQAATKEAKKTAGALAGFDELNILGGSGKEDAGVDLDALDGASYGDAKDFGKTVSDMLTKLAAGIGPAIAAILTKLKEAAPGFAKGAVAVIKAFASGIRDHLPEIIQSGTGILSALLDGLKKAVPDIGAAVTDILTTLITWFLTYSPQLIATGVAILANVITGMSERMPDIIPVAQQAIMTMMQGLRDNLPVILQSGITILLELINGISATLPSLIPMAVECVLTLVQGLANNVPMLVDSAILLIESLAQGIINALPIIIEMAPNIIRSLIEGTVNAIPKLLDCAINVVGGLVGYLVNNLGEIFECALDLIMALAEGLIKAIPELVLALPKVVKAIVDGIINTDWLKVGKDIISGIGNGLVEGVKNIGGAIKEAGGKLLDGFKGLFGIHSPSKVFADVIGANMALGIGEGFADQMGTVEKMMGKTVPDLTAAVQMPALEQVRRGPATETGSYSMASVSTGEDDGLIPGMLEALLEIVSLLRNGMTLEVEGSSAARALHPFLQAEDRRPGRTIVKVV